MAGLDTFIIRQPGGSFREAGTLVLGAGLNVRTTAGGLPELVGGAGGEATLYPSGGDDTQAIRDALAAYPIVRLAPGTFLASGEIVIPNGRALVGSGVTQTIVQASHAGALFSMQGGRIEGMILEGSSPTLAGSYGIRTDPAAVFYTRYVIREVRVSGFYDGIALEQPYVSELVSVEVLNGDGMGIRLNDVLGGVLESIHVEAMQSLGVLLYNCQNVALSAVQVFSSPVRGVMVEQSNGVTLNGVRVDGSSDGLTIYDSINVAASGVSAGLANNTGILVQGSNEVSLAAARVVESASGIVIRASQSVTVQSLLLDFNAGGSGVPYMTVDGGSLLVTAMSVRRVNPGAGIPVFELDVSGAGGRVLFAQHNFTPARINSGGNFAQV